MASITVELTKEQVASIFDQITRGACNIMNISSLVSTPRTNKELVWDFVSKLGDNALIYSQSMANTLNITTTQASGMLRTLAKHGEVVMLKRGVWRVNPRSKK